MADAVFLTIGIPTYLREESLVQLLLQLAVERPTVACEVLVINNGPDFSVPLPVDELTAAGYSVRLLRNERNCGGQENVIRVYENSSGTYTWFLGDDDRLYPDSVASVVECLQAHPCDCLMFDATAPDHPQTKLPEGMHTMDRILAGEVPLRKLMFAPLYVLRTSCLVPALAKTRLSLGCFTPQLLLTLGGSAEDFYYLARNVITCEEVNVQRDQRLSLLPVFLGLGRLPSSDLPLSVRRRLRRLLDAEWLYFLRPTNVLAAIAIAHINGKKLSPRQFIAAGFRNYPWWLAPAFPIALASILIFPKKMLADSLLFLANKVLKKDVDLKRYFSTERV